MKNDLLANRHIGISKKDEEQMLRKIGVSSLDELIDKTIPANIRLKEPLALPEAMTEYEFGQHIAALAAKNKLYTTYIGMGWYNTVTPAVIQRNVFENPVWYTSYTPYQTEVSQGRLEALLNFQTAVCDLTGMPLANCSLLDEATAAAEAVTMMYALRPRDMQKSGANVVFVDESVFPQTLAVVTTRAIPQGIQIRTGKYSETELTPDTFACIVQYPNAGGNIEDYRAFVEKAHAAGCKVAVAADILSLALLTPPGEWGADIVFGTTQRLGTPMFYGGPSAAYFATRDEYKRNMPGRIIGWSKDKYGKQCYRMALQTREQHIKREKATSNICTAQALLATMAGFYAVYHGPEGIRTIAGRIHSIAAFLEQEINKLGYRQMNAQYFDTLRFALPDNVSAQQVRTVALSKEVNLRYFKNGDVGMSIDETTDLAAVNVLLSIFGIAAGKDYTKAADIPESCTIAEAFRRQSAYLTHEVFNKYGDDALHQAAGPQGHLTGALHDFARLVHHEAERRRGDAAPQPSGIHGHAPARSRRPGGRLPRAYTQPQRGTESDNRICRRKPATQFRRCRRVCGAARNPRLSGEHRAGTPQQGADTRFGARHQSGFRRPGRFHHRYLRLRRTGQR